MRYVAGLWVVGVLLFGAGCSGTDGTDPAAELDTYTIGDVVRIQTDCPAADEILRSAVGDGLPKQGQTDRDHVMATLDSGRAALLESFGAVAAEVVPRNGQVWAGPGNGDYTIVDASDYMIEVILGPDGSCPTAPYSWGGIPVVFFRE